MASRGARIIARTCLLALLASAAGAATADEIRIGGTGAALGAMRQLAGEYSVMFPEARVVILPSLGSKGGIRAVASGAIDLAVTSFPLSEDDLRLGLTAVEYGRTPFVFAVSQASGITSISHVELAGMYAGKILQWPDGTPIRVLLRPAGDGDTRLVKALSPEIRRAYEAAENRPGVNIAATDQEAAEYLEKIPGAIGPASLSLILSEKHALRALKLDGKEPTPGNAASGIYPYSKRLFLVSGRRRSEAAVRFAAFIQSPAGRKILAANGHWFP
ncbi:MAG: substrate-binding domain-containing protein [Betaproteobacteria bacterium]|nr:substrate-binding domain-containing protein [Betaproteobacteria bacterium]